MLGPPPSRLGLGLTVDSQLPTRARARGIMGAASALVAQVVIDKTLAKENKLRVNKRSSVVFFGGKE